MKCKFESLNIQRRKRPKLIISLTSQFRINSLAWRSRWAFYPSRARAHSELQKSRMYAPWRPANVNYFHFAGNHFFRSPGFSVFFSHFFLLREMICCVCVLDTIYTACVMFVLEIWRMDYGKLNVWGALFTQVNDSWFMCFFR